jgi:DNA-binding LacI/PurR family transcriptional regulator
MMARKATSHEVARLAGVSQSTVSRAFNRQESVSQSTLKRIRAAAEQLGYWPNELARSLISRKSNMIGIVMGDILNPFYPAVLNAFTQKLQTLGRHVLLFSVPPGADIDAVLPQMLQYQVAGVVITSASLSSRMAKAVVATGTPVVLFNRIIYGNSLSSVCCANEQAATKVARLLCRAGHTRFGIVGGNADTSTHVERRRSFVKELQSRGIRSLAEESGGNTYEGGFTAARRLLSVVDRPTALFCISDIMALGALDAARHALSLSVPDEVSIIGFDDIPAAAWPTYDLTTVQQPVDAMVDEAIAILLRQIADTSASPASFRAPGTLIVRSSARLQATLPEPRPSSGQVGRPG